MFSINPSDDARFRLLCGLTGLLAFFSLTTTLFLPYIGEEAVYTITSLEMAFYDEWLVPTQYGVNYGRPPFFNWLIIPLAKLLGFSNVLVASRLVTLVATALTSVVLLGFVQKCFKNKTLSLFSVVIYLSGDVLFRRGWLSYADPLFSLLIFSAIVVLWRALDKEKLSLCFIASFLLIASFLTKALTGYIFYGITLAVLMFYSESPFYQKRRLLLKPALLIAHAIAFIFPLIWNGFLTQKSHSGSMVHDILARLDLANGGMYLAKLFFFPIDVFIIRFLPVSLIALYFMYQKRSTLTTVFKDNQYLVKTMALIILFNSAPYWLAPEKHIRYLMPLYPLIAVVLAKTVWDLGPVAIRISMRFLILGIILRYLMGFIGFPYYEAHYRGHYARVANDILAITQSAPLFVNDVTATGLSVVAEIDQQLFPSKIVTYPTPTTTNGFLISKEPDYPGATLYKTYTLGKTPLYLLQLK